MTSTPLSIIFAGSGEFGGPTLRALVAAGHRVIRVITQPDRPAGRGRHLTPTPIAALAEELGLPVLKTANINAEPLLPPSSTLPLPPSPDLMIVIAFGQKIGQPAVNAPRLGSINLHASRLPRHRGAAPINWAILSGDAVTGNSIIRLAERMDAGAVLAMSELAIGELETAGELHDRLAADGAGLVLRTLEDLAAGRAIETPQDDSQATLASKLSRSAATIDWTQPAEQIARKIRGLSPWPGCHITLLDAADPPRSRGRATLVRARAVDGEGPRWHAGEIMSDGAIAAGDGGVEIVEIQPEGKRPMSLAEYRNGHLWASGMRVESV